MINEFEQNPPGTDSGNEWVELYNPTSSDVNLSNWVLSTTHGVTVKVTIPQGTIITAHGYWVYTHSTQWLDNEDESIILQDATGSEADRTPLKNDPNNDEWCWARFPNGLDNDSATDWRLQTSTKGFSNGKASSAISCTPSVMTVNVSFPVSIMATLSPALQGKTVHIEWSTNQVTWNTLASGTTNSTGQCYYQWIPTIMQTYYLRTRWDGDEFYDGAVSEVHAIEVIPEFPTWTSMLLILTVLTIAIVIYQRKLLKRSI